MLAFEGNYLKRWLYWFACWKAFKRTLENFWNNKQLSLCAGEEAAGAKPESANRMAQQAVCHWISSENCIIT